jgi:hypothetical protein
MPAPGAAHSFVKKNNIMKSKTRTVATGVLSVLITMIIGLVASLKLASHPQITEIYSRLGLLDYLPLLGICELLFISLFLWNRTMKMGFLLLTAYFGGVMAVRCRTVHFILPILCMIWVLPPPR